MENLLQDFTSQLYEEGKNLQEEMIRPVMQGFETFKEVSREIQDELDEIDFRLLAIK